jgi:hypothetical protein
MADSLEEDLFIPRFAGNAGLRIIENFANYKYFYIVNLLIASRLYLFSPFYQWNFVPRFAGRDYGVGQILCRCDRLASRFAGRAGLRILENQADYGDFFSYHVLIGRVLGICSLLMTRILFPASWGGNRWHVRCHGIASAEGHIHGLSVFGRPLVCARCESLSKWCWGIHPNAVGMHGFLML